MNQGQKVIKYLAIVFAACLTITILGVVLNIVVSIFGAFVPDKPNGGANTGANSGRHNNVQVEDRGNQKEFVSGADSENTFGKLRKMSVESGVYSIELVVDSSVKGSKVVTKNVADDIEIRCDGDELFIDEDEYWPDVFKHKRESKGKIYIYLEEGTELDKLNIDMGVGNFTIDGIKTDELYIDCGVGSLVCRNVTASKVDIDGGVGSLKCDECHLNDLDLDGGVGEIDISGELTGKVELSAGMGEANIEIYGKREDYNIKVETGLGSIIIDGEKYKDTTNFGNNNQSNILDIEGGVGSVKVDFR